MRDSTVVYPGICEVEAAVVFLSTNVSNRAAQSMTPLYATVAKRGCARGYSQAALMTTALQLSVLSATPVAGARVSGFFAYRFTPGATG